MTDETLCTPSREKTCVFEAETDLGSTPDFEPGLAVYDIPASGVDDLGLVSCG